MVSFTLVKTNRLKAAFVSVGKMAWGPVPLGELVELIKQDSCVTAIIFLILNYNR